ncbi:hypothetical protein F4808DRAFT_435936 [Astrocystis sublimbata]|nr:hypothetical protein F4808DRAFT_435936 [Astrocystis sublimbata]
MDLCNDAVADTQCHLDDEAAFDVELDVQGNQGSGFHTKNDPRPGRQWHRDDITQRRGAISVKCNMTDIVHGKLSAGTDEDYASLIVFLFRFDIRKNSRRIARADIKITFSGIEEDPYCRPEIHDISFNDAYSLVEKTHSESTVQSVSGKAGMTGAQIAELSGSTKWEKTTTREVESRTMVVGNTYRRGFEFGGDNQVNWILKENDQFKTGIPNVFRAGILLKRGDLMPFRCEVKINLKADTRSRLEDFFGVFRPKDDLVLFNPKAMAPVGKLAVVNHQQLDTESLGKFNLQDISDITILRTYNGAFEGN